MRYFSAIFLRPILLFSLASALIFKVCLLSSGGTPSKTKTGLIDIVLLDFIVEKFEDSFENADHIHVVVLFRPQRLLAVQ